MLVYHFLSAEHALSNLNRKHLKIATVEDMNDPFELLGANMQDKRAGKMLAYLRAWAAREHGVLCFSRSWQNPLMWSHYADRHKGACLGFEVADSWMSECNYEVDRIRDSFAALTSGEPAQRETAMRRLMLTKFRDWKYEDEVRAFTELKDRDAFGHYFADFTPNLVLKSVILGTRFENGKVTAGALREAADKVTSGVDVFWTRLAFDKFEVVRDEWSG